MQTPSNKEGKSSDSVKESIDVQQTLSGEKWLRSIFQNPNDNEYIFPDEEKVFTKRYLEFYNHELAMFEYPDFETEQDQMNAENEYKNKWKAIYPLGNEVWAPFGRGNGIEAGTKLENVTITHLFGSYYSALINYDAENAFFNALILVPSGDVFLIDYIETMEINVQGGAINLPFLQNITLAKLQLGANPDDAKRLLGKPQSESTENGPLEVSGYIDEDYSVTTTTMEFEGIKLIFDEERMIHATVNKTGRQFGWIICGDKNCDTDFLMKKFNLTEDNIYESDNGDKTVVMNWEIFSLVVLLDANGLVKTINFNAGS